MAEVEEAKGTEGRLSAKMKGYIQRLDELLTASLADGFMYDVTAWPDRTNVHFGRVSRVRKDGKFSVMEVFRPSMSDLEIEALFDGMKQKAD